MTGWVIIIVLAIIILGSMIPHRGDRLLEEFIQPQCQYVQCLLRQVPLAPGNDFLNNLGIGYQLTRNRIFDCTVSHRMFPLADGASKMGQETRRMLISMALAECVRAPIDIISTPVEASS